MVAGRPQEYDREKIAQDLIEWAKLDDSINLNKFCAYNDLAPATFFRWRDEDPKFRESYEKAKTFLGFRREELLNAGKLHVKAYDFNATAYDAFTREERRREKEFEAETKRLSEEQVQDLLVKVISYADSVKKD